MYKETL